MKKIIITSCFVVLTVLAITGCGGKETPPMPNDPVPVPQAPHLDPSKALPPSGTPMGPTTQTN